MFGFRWSCMLGAMALPVGCAQARRAAGHGLVPRRRVGSDDIGQAREARRGRRPKVDIGGNSHMMMDRNNLEFADSIQAWPEKQGLYSWD